MNRPHPRSATTAAEFLAALHELRRWAGQPSLRTMTQLAGKVTLDGRHQATRLPVSTISDNLAGKRLPHPPSQSFVRAYVEACMRARGYDERDIPAVVDDWDQAREALSAPVERARRWRPAVVRRLAVVGALALLAIVAVTPSRLANTTDAIAPPAQPAPRAAAPAPAPLPPPRPSLRSATPPVKVSIQPPVRHPATRRAATPPKAKPPARRPAPQDQTLSEKLGAGIAQQRQAYDPANWNPNG